MALNEKSPDGHRSKRLAVDGQLILLIQLLGDCGVEIAGLVQRFNRVDEWGSVLGPSLDGSVAAVKE